VKELVNLIGPEYNANHAGGMTTDAYVAKMASDIPAPVKAAAVSAAINYEKAWSIISDSMPTIPELHELMTALGVDSADYLEGLEQDELTQISSLLPTVKKRLFTKAMCMN